MYVFTLVPFFNSMSSRPPLTYNIFNNLAIYVQSIYTHIYTPARSIQSIFSILANISTPFWNRTYDFLLVDVKNCTLIGANNSYPLRFIRHRSDTYNILLTDFSNNDYIYNIFSENVSNLDKTYIVFKFKSSLRFMV